MGEHWYKPDGSPFYRIVGSNGVERAVTIRDARKIGAVPSVTTVLSVLAKPALEAWKVRQGILAALTLPMQEGEVEDAYLGRIMEDSKAQAIAAADEGTRIHDAVEDSFKGRPVLGAYRLHVLAVRTELETVFPHVSDWVAEKSFTHASDGFGGKVDLHSPSTGIVVDFKGKDGDFSDGKKLAYDQNHQLAAYQRGLVLAPNVCANIFVSRTHPGKVCSKVWSAEEISDGLSVFLAALQVWKALRKYDAGANGAAC